MKGIITSIDPKKVIVETTDGDEHTYLPKRLRYSGAQRGDHVIVRKGTDGTEIVKDEAKAPAKPVFRRKPEPVKKQPEPEPEYDDDDDDYDTDINDTGDEEDPYNDRDDEDIYDEKPEHRTRKKRYEPDDGYDEEDDDEDYQQQYPVQREKSSKGLAGFVFSTVSLIGGLIPAIIGFHLSRKVKKETDDDMFANAGYTIGKIQIIIQLILILFILIFSPMVTRSIGNLVTKFLSPVQQTTTTYDSSDDSSDSSSDASGDDTDYSNTGSSSYNDAADTSGTLDTVSTD